MLIHRSITKSCNRGFVTEINAFGYESCYASYKGGEQWRQGMLKVRRRWRVFLSTVGAVCVVDWWGLIPTHKSHNSTCAETGTS